MTPDNLEVVLLGIVGASLVAVDGRDIGEVEVATEAITLGIGRMPGDAPRTFCIDLSA